MRECICPKCLVVVEVSEPYKERQLRRVCPTCKQTRERKLITVPCKVCKTPVTLTPCKAKRAGAHCSDKCVQVTMRRSRKKSGVWLTEFNKKHCSERMKKNNPVYMPGVLAKIESTKRANGTLNVWTGKRGGNGQLTPQQEKVAIALGWKMEVVVSTAVPLLTAKKNTEYRRKHKYPTHYKIDVANRELLIAIEIDGKGHLSKRNQTLDAKKEVFLKKRGWSVLRFTNEQVDSNLKACVETVLSII